METKKKNAKRTEKAERKLENEIENMEKNVAEIEIEGKRMKELKEKEEAIREDLKNQLMQQNKFGKQFEDMIEDYIFFFKMKENMRYDIEVNGIRYKNTGGNGFTTFRPNESVLNILKVNGQMLKILQDLALKAPDEEGGGDDLL